LIEANDKVGLLYAQLEKAQVAPKDKEVAEVMQEDESVIMKTEYGSAKAKTELIQSCRNQR
jgi:hypothetical protein